MRGTATAVEKAKIKGGRRYLGWVSNEARGSLPAFRRVRKLSFGIVQQCHHSASRLKGQIARIRRRVSITTAP